MIHSVAILQPHCQWWIIKSHFGSGHWKSSSMPKAGILSTIPPQEVAQPMPERSRKEFPIKRFDLWTESPLSWAKRAEICLPGNFHLPVLGIFFTSKEKKMEAFFPVPLLPSHFLNHSAHASVSTASGLVLLSGHSTTYPSSRMARSLQGAWLCQYHWLSPGWRQRRTSQHHPRALFIPSVSPLPHLQGAFVPGEGGTKMVKFEMVYRWLW